MSLEQLTESQELDAETLSNPNSQGQEDVDALAEAVDDPEETARPPSDSENFTAADKAKMATDNLSTFLTFIAAWQTTIARNNDTEAVHKDMEELEMTVTLLLSKIESMEPEDTFPGQEWDDACDRWVALNEVCKKLEGRHRVPKRFTEGSRSSGDDKRPKSA